MHKAEGRIQELSSSKGTFTSRDGIELKWTEQFSSVISWRYKRALSHFSSVFPK